MTNTVYGPFTAINVVNGSTPANATWGNNVQTQAAAALHGFNPSLIAAGFIFSGVTCTKDGVTANQLDIASGVAFLVMTDGTIGQITVGVDNTHTTATPTTTYYLDLNPDGSWSWGTSHSAVANHLTICSVATDGSGNIASVTDLRVTAFTLFSGALGVPGLPQLSADAGLITSDGLGALSLAAAAAPSPAPAAATATNTTTDTYSHRVLGDSPVRYYRLGESVGTTATDSSASAQNGTYSATGVTYGVTGLLNADSNTCVTLAAGSSGKVTVPNTGLPTGNSPISFECWFEIAATPAGSLTLWGYGASANTAHNAMNLWVGSDGNLHADCGGGQGQVNSAGTISTGAPHYAALTWDGTTLSLYLDNAAAVTSTPGANTIAASPNCFIGTNPGNANFFSGQMDEAAIYSAKLTATQTLNHYIVGHGGPDAVTLPGVGTYHYTVTFASAVSETAQSAQASVTTTTGNQKVNLSSIPTGPRGTTKRKIYRTALNGSTPLLLTTLADNTTTTYTDATPDSSLGAVQNSSTTGRTSGVPRIVAQQIAYPDTFTGNVAFLTTNNLPAGLYRVSGAFNQGNTATQNITFSVSYTDRNGVVRTAYFSNGAGTVYNGVTSIAVGDYCAVPLSFSIQNNSTITVNFNDPAGTPNDYVSAVVEQLA